MSAGWQVGRKAQIGVDAKSGLMPTMVTNAANVSDVTQASQRLHGEEKDVFGDAGDQGVEKREQNKDAQLVWPIAMRPGKRRALPDDAVGRLDGILEKSKATLRTKTPPPFHSVKKLFRHSKNHDFGLTKHRARLFTLFALANRMIAKGRLFTLDAQGAS